MGYYLPNGREKAYADMSIGDLVLLYQAKTGRPEGVVTTSGEQYFIDLKQGKEGILVIAKVLGNLILYLSIYKRRVNKIIFV